MISGSRNVNSLASTHFTQQVQQWGGRENHCILTYTIWHPYIYITVKKACNKCNTTIFGCFLCKTFLHKWPLWHFIHIDLLLLLQTCQEHAHHLGVWKGLKGDRNTFSAYQRKPPASLSKSKEQPSGSTIQFNESMLKKQASEPTTTKSECLHKYLQLDCGRRQSSLFKQRFQLKQCGRNEEQSESDHSKPCFTSP